jgi:hypothetical protein
LYASKKKSELSLNDLIPLLTFHLNCLADLIWFDCFYYLILETITEDTLAWRGQQVGTLRMSIYHICLWLYTQIHILYNIFIHLYVYIIHVYEILIYTEIKPLTAALAKEFDLNGRGIYVFLWYTLLLAVNILIQIHKCIHVFLCTYIHAWMYVYIYIYIDIYICINICMHLYIHIYIDNISIYTNSFIRFLPNMAHHHRWPLNFYSC